MKTTNYCSFLVKPDYFIVPKPLKNVSKGSRYWRLSFQEQERVIIDSKGNLKPALRFIKVSIFNKSLDGRILDYTERIFETDSTD